MSLLSIDIYALLVVYHNSFVSFKVGAVCEDSPLFALLMPLCEKPDMFKDSFTKYDYKFRLVRGVRVGICRYST